MKIRIERFELELPELVESILDYKLKGELSYDQRVNDLYRTACSVILEIMGKAFSPAAVRPATQEDIDQMLGRVGRVGRESPTATQEDVRRALRGLCPNCGGPLIVTGDSAVGLYKCVRCYVARKAAEAEVSDGEVVSTGTGTGDDGAGEEPPPAGVGG